MSEQLKPCPFCGDVRDLEILVNDHIAGGKTYKPYCRKCGGQIQEWETEEEAISAWNSRADSALLREALGLLESAPVPFHQPESYLTWAAKRAALLAKAGKGGGE